MAIAGSFGMAPNEQVQQVRLIGLFATFFHRLLVRRQLESKMQFHGMLLRDQSSVESFLIRFFQSVSERDNSDRPARAIAESPIA